MTDRRPHGLILRTAGGRRLLEKGVFAIGFFYPGPRGKARVRTQISAAHSRDDLDFAVRAFAEVREEYGFQTAGYPSPV